jgi:hypothetical protein
MVTVSFDPGSVLQGLGILIAVVLAFLVIRAAWRGLRKLLFQPKLVGLDRAGISTRWQGIEAMAKGVGEMQYKMALMEADKLLDHALKALAMPGETLGERLKFAAYKYPKISDVWWAHRLRNQLVHESSFHLDSTMAKKAVAQYGSALRLLNLL